MLMLIGVLMWLMESRDFETALLRARGESLF
jgi:hypothetical protein